MLVWLIGCVAYYLQLTSIRSADFQSAHLLPLKMGATEAENWGQRNSALQISQIRWSIRRFQKLERTSDADPRLLRGVQIDLRRGYIGVAQEILDIANTRP